MATTTGMIESVHDAEEIARRPLQSELCTLVVVDIQERLLPPIFEKDRLIRNSQLLIRLANILKMPVLATTQYAKGLGPIVPEIASLLPPSPASTKWNSAASAATNSARR